MKWQFKPKMEAMTGKVLEKRIRDAMNYETPALALMPYLGRHKERVVYQCDELVALCPVTGILDLYSVRIEYVPKNHLAELKSLKFYFLSFKDLPIGHEHLAAKIYDDFRRSVRPEKMRLFLDVAVRGGIKTSVSLGDLL